MYGGFDDVGASDLFKKSLQEMRKLSSGQGGGLGSRYAFNHGLKILVDTHTVYHEGLTDRELKWFKDQWTWNTIGRQGNNYKPVDATYTVARV
jgi:hypothetical protein